ncbi:MAG TPA: tripartite tricarboxylate transporter substrate binding protein [Burkholderiales bacterium]|nr:tripartite tricarboxylate transporter substrate binding protein [Burkholderiales bacterium]
MRLPPKYAICAGAIALAACSLPALGQTYPTRAVRLVVPFAPGGSTDVLGRIIGQRLSESVGQPVIVDNRPAGGGTVGSDVVAKALPDGHTLLIGSIATMAFAKAMYPKLPYDPMGDFEHIGLWVSFPLALVVQAGAPISGLKDLLDQARARPGTLKHGLQGIGTSSHIFNELMCSMAGVKVVNVPYKGGAPALIGVLVGEVNYAMVAVSTALTQVATSKVRALGVTSARATPSLPNVPPIASVLPGYNALNFHGLHAPAKTPKAITARLHAETTAILKRPDVQEKLAGLAMDVAASTPEEYRAFIKAQIAQWTPVVKATGARGE